MLVTGGISVGQMKEQFQPPYLVIYNLAIYAPLICDLKKTILQKLYSYSMIFCVDRMARNVPQKS